MTKQRLRTITIAVGGLLVLGLTGCGNTIRGVGQDMETVGQRMQGSYSPPPQQTYYR